MQTVTAIVKMFGGSPAAVWGVCLALVALGLVQLLLGQRYFKTLLFVYGFAIWYGIAQFFASTVVSLACGAIGGILAIIFMYGGLFFIGMFMYAAVIVSLNLQDVAVPLHSLLVIVCGVLAIVFKKYVVVPATAWVGANFLMWTICFMIGGMNAILLFLLTLLVACGGSFVQFKYTAKKATKSDAVTEDNK